MRILSAVWVTSLVVPIIFSVNVNSETVKKSKSDICHDRHSSYYDRTKNYTSFSTLDGCLDSGGRLPKNYKGKALKASSSKPQSSAQSNHGSSPKYSRSKFGHGWADLNKDCQNSRMEALISQSVGQVHYKTSKKCKVKSGKWISTFTGKTIYSASEIDIDHVVPLSWAWKHGGHQWTKDKRVKFANDPANLLSVEARVNRQKGARGLDEWLPPKNKCQYVSRFLRVYKSYGLKLTINEGEKYAGIKKHYCSK